MKSKKVNPNCSVVGCRTERPHTSDPIVVGLLREFSNPIKLATHALAAMAELRSSIERDYRENLIFSWYLRLRQPEELYIRTLYALFVANADEMPHVMSGDPPNSLSQMYAKVNEHVFRGKGALLTVQPGLQFGEFKPIDMLHAGAHVSFATFLTCIGLVHNPEVWQEKAEKHLQHLSIYCDRLNYMRQMFEAGRDRAVILEALRNMHQ
jgi:hypothetical protein